MKKTFGLAHIVCLALAGALLVATLPAPAFTLLENQTFKFIIAINLERAAICDDGARLAPGKYDVEVSGFADGSVRAVFKQGGMEKGHASGKLQVKLNEQQHKFNHDGQRLVLEIGSPGQTQILVGMLLPAVQRAREAAVPPAGEQLPAGATKK